MNPHPSRPTGHAGPTGHASPVAARAPARRLSALTLALATLLATGCANLAPTQGTPAAAIPTAWPAGGTAATATASGQPQAGSIGWQALVSDARLRGAIALALQHNRDLRQAALAVQQARAAHDIQSAAQRPTLQATAGASASRTPGQATSSGQASSSRSLSAGLGIAAWEIDLFGRLQNLKDAALESYLQTEQAQRSTQLTLVAELAQAWLSLAADQAQLQLAEQTLKSQRDSLALVQRRQALGVDSALTVAQTEATVESARLAAAAYAAQVAQDRNALDLLAGTAVPAELLPQLPLQTDAAVLVAVPEGLPSSVLQRRPDVLAAEHQLRAAAADIGAARAALYPSISLTASAGTASRSLGQLFQGGAWSFAPSISLPIFDSGARQASLRSAELARDSQLAAYDKTLQTAFREVADALAVRQSLAERLAAQQALVAAYAKALSLSQARQRNGVDTALDVLDAQRSLFAARQALISLQLLEQGNRITLFKVLGGGWADATAAAAG
ncbi:efflux transporter outer membrane subunit [Aquabacterium sp. OR-4]|uniref:efflux transporter outer membrane subunit n=1 Tax=Aquabacterium sp. OR-4 TaxID=2978127 RepID=UPI0021B1D44F|nr:efflux transporter outer membrane subunit [Aquabacterium sp. OR-4]MDT7838042.1 efflux transporter outer membrane subunit [Aquabacterium sp. OR-4]